MGYGQRPYGQGSYKGQYSEGYRPNYIDNTHGLCLNLALPGMESEQGIGWSEFSGADLVFGEANVNPEEILDDNGFPRLLTLDESTGRYYETDTYDGPAGAGLAACWTDKAPDEDNDGAEIEVKIFLPEVAPTADGAQIEHEYTGVGLRPEDPDSRDATGYDENGFRDGL